MEDEEKNPLADKGRNELEALFRSDLNYEGFKEYQYEVIYHILNGDDTIAVMPSGYGKSACFQFVAKHLEGMTIVVEPLIALMRDQRNSAVNLGIPACYIVNQSSFKGTISKDKKLIFISPEVLVSPKFCRYARDELNISMLVADEAHCVPMWGKTFRPAFTRINDFCQILGKRPRIAAFTATATKCIRNEIAAFLHMEDPFDLVEYVKEKNHGKIDSLFKRNNIDIELVGFPYKKESAAGKNKKGTRTKYENRIWMLKNDLLSMKKGPHDKYYKEQKKVFDQLFPDEEKIIRAKMPKCLEKSPLPIKLDKFIYQCSKLALGFWEERKSIEAKYSGDEAQKKIAATYKETRKKAIELYFYCRRKTLSVAVIEDKYDRLVKDILSVKDGKKVIVYCSYVDTVNILYDKLSKDRRLKERKIFPCRYYSKLSDKKTAENEKQDDKKKVRSEKEKQQTLFTDSPDHRVMIATIAFSMGIDIEDVDLVINFEVPHDIETYYQEVGRAGRNGDVGRAKALTYYYEPDLEMEKRKAEFENLDFYESMKKMILPLIKDVSRSKDMKILDGIIRYFQEDEDLEPVSFKETNLPCALYMNVCGPANKLCGGESLEPDKVHEVLHNMKTGERYTIQTNGKIDFIDVMIANAVYTLGMNNDDITIDNVYYMLTGQYMDPIDQGELMKLVKKSQTNIPRLIGRFDRGYKKVQEQLECLYGVMDRIEAVSQSYAELIGKAYELKSHVFNAFNDPQMSKYLDELKNAVSGHSSRMKELIKVHSELKELTEQIEAEYHVLRELGSNASENEAGKLKDVFTAVKKETRGLVRLIDSMTGKLDTYEKALDNQGKNKELTDTTKKLKKGLGNLKEDLNKLDLPALRGLIVNNTREELKERIGKMMRTRIELTCNGKHPNHVCSQKWEGPFLPLTPINDVYCYDGVPPLFRYSEEHNNEFFTVALSQLGLIGEDQGQSKKAMPCDLESIAINTFIARRVHLLPKYRTHKGENQLDDITGDPIKKTDKKKNTAKGVKTFNVIRFKHKGRQRKGMFDILEIAPEKQKAAVSAVREIMKKYAKTGLIKSYLPIRDERINEVVGFQIDKVASVCRGMPEHTLFLNDITELPKLMEENKMSFFDLMVYGANKCLDEKDKKRGEQSAKRILAMISGNDGIPVRGKLWEKVKDSRDKLMNALKFECTCTEEIPRTWLNVKGPKGAKIVPDTVESLELRMYIAWRIKLAEKDETLDLMIDGKGGVRKTLYPKPKDGEPKDPSKMITSILRHLMRVGAIKDYQLKKDSAKTVKGYTINLKKKNKISDPGA